MEMPIDIEKASSGVRDFVGRVAKLRSETATTKFLEFQPKSDDVMIATPLKSGTTWMQMICHGLRSRGNMDFEEIDMVIPIIEYAYDYGYTDLDAEQVATPRMFKSHVPYNLLPKTFGKYIRVIRNPNDAAISLYYFALDWFFTADEVSMDQFLEEFVLACGGRESALNAFCPWNHIADWYSHRADPNVLWIHYEDMHENLPAVVKLVSQFLGVGVGDDELQQLVLKQASFDFMKQHREKFDQHNIKQCRNEAVDLPKDAGLTGANLGKVRDGKIGGHKKEASPKILEDMHKKWAETVQPVTGFASYEEMRKAINAELGRPFGLLNAEQ